MRRTNPLHSISERFFPPHITPHLPLWSVSVSNSYAYFGGFVANRMRRWTKCIVCLSTLTKERGDDPRDALINELSKGYLLYPSNELHGLLTGCERARMFVWGFRGGSGRAEVVVWGEGRGPMWPKGGGATHAQCTRRTKVSPTTDDGFSKAILSEAIRPVFYCSYLYHNTWGL